MPPTLFQKLFNKKHGLISPARDARDDCVFSAAQGFLKLFLSDAVNASSQSDQNLLVMSCCILMLVRFWHSASLSPALVKLLEFHHLKVCLQKEL